MKKGAYMILSLFDCWVLLNLSKTTNCRTPSQVGISSAIRLAEIIEILMSWMENQERALLSRIRQEFYKFEKRQSGFCNRSLYGGEGNVFWPAMVTTEPQNRHFMGPPELSICSETAHDKPSKSMFRFF